MKFSIIIPCYNISKYLERCLKSIINQKFQDWEIILVNDGSIDNTEEVIKVYTEKDNRIKVISQKNQGLSVARNNGVKEAKGEYILFLDGDDWYKSNNCLENISKAIEDTDPDIVVFRYQRVTDNGDFCGEDVNLQCFKQMKNTIYSGEQYLYHVLSQDIHYAWYPWRYSFKKEFWKDNKFEFRLRRFEDIDIIYQVLLKAQKIKLLNEPIYQYRTAREGALTQISKESLKSLIDVSKSTIDTVNHINIDERLKMLLNSNFSYGYFFVLKHVNYLKKDNKKEIFNLLYENQNLINYTFRKKDIVLRRIISIWGLHITSILLYIRLKLGRQ